MILKEGEGISVATGEVAGPQGWILAQPQDPGGAKTWWCVNSGALAAFRSVKQMLLLS